MGASQSTQLQYNKAVASPDTEGSSPIYRNAEYPATLIDNLEQPAETCADFFLATVARRGSAPFLGRRQYLGDDTYGDYEWITYAEALETIKKIGTAFVNQKLVEPHFFPEHDKSLSIIGIFAKNCVEWFYIEQVCNLFGYSICPLYDTLGYESLRHILSQTCMSTLCIDNLDAFIDLLNQHGFPYLKHLILLNESQSVPEDVVRSLKLKGISVYQLQDLIKSSDGVAAPLTPAKDGVHTVCYTSGTGGLPKGCLITQATAVAIISTALRFMVIPGGLCEFRLGDRFLSFLPLAHVYERCVCNIVIAYGNCIGVYSGDIKRLVEDIQTLRPSLLFTVPRVINKIHDKITMSVAEKPFAAQIVFRRGLEAKVRQKHRTGDVTHAFWDRAVFAKTKEVLNSELRMIVSGGAPLHPKVADEASCCFSVPVVQGYGLTETFGPCFLGACRDPDSSIVGSVWPCLEFKLVSIPELNHFVSDTPPTGEICLRGPGVVSEYLCHVKVEELWDEQGWYHTGDIAVLLPNKGVRIIGRKRQIFKLSQGEYILPEKIENIYSQSVYIEQIFISGNSFKTHPVALIVPSQEAAVKWAESQGLALGSLKEFCDLAAFRELVLNDMEIVAKANNLNGFEKPKECRFISDAFTPENLRLTPTLKIVRQRILEDYRELLEEMYASMP
eukprot:Gregarina_sp_Pseudo_9__3849@NODE_39_length_5284_cov_104_254719_g36_i0_p1_GENE_NODE_39_length_5284_cov_104_254719_g36_i0NODE_39_length_5284_cov_104_254719_g36_i0_p1_ORF_typecomplete_len672_score109_31AMPbinding/PF00501_28/2_2e68_NODE_39_length_5284_cov_104_254719_g36_i031955210